jgi:hypothetical protein
MYWLSLWDTYWLSLWDMYRLSFLYIVLDETHYTRFLQAHIHHIDNDHSLPTHFRMPSKVLVSSKFFIDWG